MYFGAFSIRLLSARRRWLAPTAVALVACAGLARSAPAYQPFQRAWGQVGEPIPAGIEASIAMLREEGATPSQRQDAAKVIVGMAGVPAVRAEIELLLSGPLSAGARSLLKAIGSLPEAHPRLFPIITQRLSDATPEETPELLAAMGAFRTREAVRVLARYVEEEKGEAAAGAAMAALARLSARDDLPMVRAAWAAFAQEVDQFSDSQWRVRLIGAMSAREQRVEGERRDALTQLVEANRKLHLATPVEERPAFLASLLLNDLDEVRNLGFELIARELSVTGRLDGPVGAASLKLLRHRDPEVRANAAVLVRQLAPDGAETAVAEALMVETDPKAAADLLLAAARWPSSEVVPSVVRWARGTTVATDASFEAAWWLLRAGELRGDAAEEVLKAVRATLEGDLTPAAVWLLAELGDDEDRSHLVPLLRSPLGAVRQAAGEALMWFPDLRGHILDAAETDADLFDLASRAVLVSNPTAERVRRLFTLPMPSADVANRAILRAANWLTAEELLGLARDVADPTLRRGLLNLLLAPQRLMSEKVDPTMLVAISEGVLELADLELSERQPEAALAVLDNAPFAEPLVSVQRLASLRCAALLGLGDVELAQGFNVPIDAWIRGLHLAKGTEAAPKVLQEIESRFGSTMTPDQRLELDGIRKELADAATVKKSAERTRLLGPG